MERIIIDKYQKKALGISLSFFAMAFSFDILPQEFLEKHLIVNAIIGVSIFGILLITIIFGLLNTIAIVKNHSYSIAKKILWISLSLVPFFFLGYIFFGVILNIIRNGR